MVAGSSPACTKLRDVSQLVDGMIWGHVGAGSSPVIPTKIFVAAEFVSS